MSEELERDSGDRSRVPRFHVITVFPEMIEGALGFGVVGQALKAGTLQLSTLSPRHFTSNVHQTVDDRPFGGGDGMVMLAEPLALTVESLTGLPGEPGPAVKVIHMSPRGVRLDDEKTRALAKEVLSGTELIVIASRYGGVDQRFLNEFVHEEISVGDFVLSGGELPALVLIDAVARHLPGVLGNEASPQEESFSPALVGLEGPQYSRPREWRGLGIPSDLLSGHHGRIESWKKAISVLVTLERRPDLLSKSALDRKLLLDARELLGRMTDQELRGCGLGARWLILRRLEERIAHHGEARK